MGRPEPSRGRLASRSARPATRDSRARRSRSAAVRGSPALAIARTCFSSSLRASASGTRDGKHLYRALGLELENEELVPHHDFELGERQMHELLARDVQRERAALVEHFDRRR